VGLLHELVYILQLMTEAQKMERVLEAKYVYEQNGRQEFRIEVYRDGNSFVGRGFSLDGKQLTRDLRVSAEMEDLARIDSTEAVISGVQGMIIGIIHAHLRSSP
jgi:hypothetical protein